MVTAFEPFQGWEENSSKICLSMLSHNHNLPYEVTTSVYPVDFQIARQMVRNHIEMGFDYAIHLGQYDRSSAMSLETIALNIGVDECDKRAPFKLIENGPLADQSKIPMITWRQLLNDHGIPAVVSYYAGTYLCNAVYYWSLYYSRELKANTLSAFIHVPLTKAQAKVIGRESDGQDVKVCKEGLNLILNKIIIGSD